MSNYYHYQSTCIKITHHYDPAVWWGYLHFNHQSYGPLSTILVSFLILNSLIIILNQFLINNLFLIYLFGGVIYLSSSLSRQPLFPCPIFSESPLYRVQLFPTLRNKFHYNNNNDNNPV